MKSSEDLYKKFSKALHNFYKIIKVNTQKLTPVLVDAVKITRITKFEYCAELTWKTIKAFLLDKEGVDAKSPKGAIREFFLKKYISEKEFDDLIQMIDDRNALSHVYSEEAFDLISDKLDSYNRLMKKMRDEIKKGILKL